MDKASFFEAGDDFHFPSGGGADPFEEGLRIACIAQRAGGNDPDGVGTDVLHSTVKAAKHLYCTGDGFGRKKSAAEDGLAEPSDFAVFINLGESMAGETRDLEADRVRSDINRSERRHGEGNSLPRGGWKE